MPLFGTSPIPNWSDQMPKPSYTIRLRNRHSNCCEADYYMQAKNPLMKLAARSSACPLMFALLQDLLMP
eukprot:CAMPEP_0115228148 /NCGR_PEP_ID=MMETSP0270-20121206/31519_1 /TAXON_ID=71861 /ORGANISM="Scrippsiella trochoidea, Strain CCMP3099" /LENGTH=68 /DNA_ID=CAMNT_0002642637 /DNA_START=32 /DNA_END=238 /DNA_ORIENTATION=-